MDEPTLDALAAGSALADPSVDSDTALDVLAALRTLGPEQRAVLVLVDMLGYPVADTAEILGISPGTVKSRCARGPGPAAAAARAPARRRRRPARRSAARAGPGQAGPARPAAEPAPARNRPAVPRVSPAEGAGDSQS